MYSSSLVSFIRLFCYLIRFSTTQSSYSSGCNEKCIYSSQASDQSYGCARRPLTSEFKFEAVNLEIKGGLFKGFLIQARKVSSPDLVVKGTMQGPSTLTAPLCGGTGVRLNH